MFVRRAMVLLADSHNVNLMKNIIDAEAAAFIILFATCSGFPCRASLKKKWATEI